MLKLTRRDFIKAGIFSIASLSMSGCFFDFRNKTDYNYLNNSGFEFSLVLYDINDSNIGKIRDLPFSTISDIKDKHSMIVVNNCIDRLDFGDMAYFVKRWQANDVWDKLTSGYPTSDEALKSFENNFNIIEKHDATELIVNEYGLQESYLNDDIQKIVDKYEQEYVKRYKKATR